MVYKPLIEATEQAAQQARARASLIVRRTSRYSEPPSAAALNARIASLQAQLNQDVELESQQRSKSIHVR